MYNIYLQPVVEWKTKVAQNYSGNTSKRYSTWVNLGYVVTFKIILS